MTASSCSVRRGVCQRGAPVAAGVSRSLRLVLDRLSADWQQRFDPPVVPVETFVAPEEFCPLYRANGRQELGQTGGFGRGRRDFCLEHNQPSLSPLRISREKRRAGGHGRPGRLNCRF